MSRRWTVEEENNKRQELIKLYERQNKTIKEVGLVLGVAESTVFDRLKRLNISSCPEKKPGFCNRRQDIIIPNLFSDKLAEFIGVMLGDGQITRTQIVITIGKNETDYLRYLYGLIKVLFGASPKHIERFDRGVYVIYLGSVELVRFLREMGLVSNKVREQVDLPKWILKDKEWGRAFLRGFFDTDGSIYKLRFGVQMSFCNHSIPLLRSTRKILLNLDYHPSEISAWKVYLTRKSDLHHYAENVGFSNKKHLRRGKELGVFAY